MFVTTTNAKRTVLKFVEKINEHDAEALTILMSGVTWFVHSLGNVVKGRENMREGWKGYFAWFPTTRFRFQKFLGTGPPTLFSAPPKEHTV